MQITTLGTTAVDGRPVPGRRLADLLRALAARPGRTVPAAALVDEVWPDGPPADPPGALQALVARLRRLGVPVSTVPEGYALGPGAEVDAVVLAQAADRAETALRAGRPADAVAQAHTARAVLGPAPDLADPVVSRLFTRVVGVWARAGLAGGGDVPLDDLRAAADGWPPDEPLVALAVRALAADGREAEALDLVERVRTAVRDTLGADLSPALAQTHLALLRGELSVPTPDQADAAEPHDVGLPGQAETQPDPDPDQSGPGQADAPAPRPVAPAGPSARVDHRPGAWRRDRHLVGRDDDTARVADALADAPLVTLVAPGGAGKTALAAQVAAGWVAAGHSVRVVELAGVREADGVVPAVLAGLGGEPVGVRAPDEPVTGHRDPAARLAAALADVTGLVVLDNCEHLLAEVARTATALLDAAGPVVLATSRAPLGVAGERVLRLGALREDEAVALLAERARAAGGPADLDDATARALVRRLDGLPLAVELAAARARSMPLADVLAGLADRSDRLDDALRGLPERHSSLWAMVDWSWDLLDPSARDLLCRLAVVPSSFPASAAAEVAGETGDGPQGTADGRSAGADHGVAPRRRGRAPAALAATTRRALAALVEQSLLELVTDDDEPRYRMLETVREYGEARLGCASTRDDALDGLARWAAARAATLVDGFTGATQVASVQAVRRDEATFLAVLGPAVTARDEAVAYPVAAALFWSWTVRGLHDDVGPWASRLLYADDPTARAASPTLSGAPGVPAPPEAALAVGVTVGLSARAVTAARTVALAHRVLRRALAEHGDALPPRQVALARQVVGLRSWSGEPGPVTDAAAALSASDDPYLRGLGLFFCAVLADNDGGGAAATDLAQRAYDAFAQAGDEWGMGTVAQGMGQWLAFGHDPGGPDAREWLARSVAHLERLDAAPDLSTVRVMLDVARADAGDAEAAARLEVLLAASDTDPFDAAQAALALAAADVRAGRPADAHVAAALRRSDEIQFPQAKVALEVSALTARLRGGDPAPTAATDTRRLVDTAIAAGDVPIVGMTALLAAELAARTGDADRARTLWAVGGRMGASSVRGFPPDAVLLAVLGDDAARAARRDALADLPHDQLLALLTSEEPHTRLR